MRKRIRRYRPNLKKHLFILVSAIIIFSIVILILDAKARPLLEIYSEAAAENEVSLIVNEAISDFLKSENITYNSLVNIEKDDSGTIRAITTDIVNLNLLKSEIDSVVSKKIEENGKINVKIPLSILFGFEAFSGFGPTISVKLNIVGNSNCEIRNSFESAGINQTLHRIILDIEVEVFVVLSSKEINFTYKTNMCIAETVIVGITPSSFGSFYSGNK